MKIKLCILLIGFLTHQYSFGQSKIAGKVTDADSAEPLPGVTVLVKGTTTGTITDTDGNYSIDATYQDVLVYSFVGYTTNETMVNGRSVIDISLRPDIVALDELVVIGYGTQRKSDITGSVASVNTDDFNPGPVISVSSHLQNTAPGVVMTQTSAQPGGNFSVQVRGQTSILGSNEPLYVIDGLPIVNNVSVPGSSTNYSNSPPRNPLNGINPQDIVSIEVLKDASAAAIYGARGANGVVLITTRQGGGTSKIQYDASFSIQEVAKKYDLLNAQEYAQTVNEFSVFNNSQPRYSASEIAEFGRGTDWAEQVLRRGTINRHQISVSGGKSDLKYYVSGNYLNHQGVAKRSGIERYSGKVNLTNDFSDNFRIGTNLSVSQTNDDQIHFGSSIGGGPELTGVFDNTLWWDPTIPVREPDGSLSDHPTRPTQIPHPLSLLDISDRIGTKRFLGTVYGEYTILEGLKAKLNLGVDDITSKRKTFIPNSTLRGEQVNGEGQLGTTSAQNLLSEFTVSYGKDIDNLHSINALVGYTYQKSVSDGFNITATGFASQITNVNDIGGASVVFPPSSFKESSKLISYIGRVNYSFDDRFLLTTTIRADGSTKFGPNNKWGYFPSAALAWKIHNEEFFASAFIETLKFRLSYGRTGNQEIGNKLSQALYGGTRNFILGTDENLAVGLATTRPPNDNLKWETTTQYNVGFDISLMAGRIQSTLDLYRKITTDLLLEFDLPSTSGFNSITTNAGALQNHGIELQITSYNLRNGMLEWTTTASGAYNSNKWKDRAGLPFPVYEDEFGPVGGLYSYIVDGIWQLNDDIANSAQPTSMPGQFRFRDVNNDGEITPEDRVFIGKSQPDLTFGLNNTLSYGRFDLNFFIQGVMGVHKHNFIRADLNNVNDILFGRNQSREVLNRWTSENAVNDVPVGSDNVVGDDYFNSLYIEDASFVRLRNVTIGYNIPSNKTFTNLRIYADGQNLYWFTKWTGLDPETFAEGEFPEYPNARTYSLGISATF